jgi:hypothetical protein
VFKRSDHFEGAICDPLIGSNDHFEKICRVVESQSILELVGDNLALVANRENDAD